MISGIALLTSLCWTAASPAASPEAPPPDAAALIASLALPVPSDTAYAETRFLHVLRKPIELRGTLHYGGAATLGKRVDAPYKESTTIADGNVEVQRDGKPARRFALERAPELEALLASFSALLGGDAAALSRHFGIVLRRDGANWQLSLTPRDAGLAGHLKDLVVDGRDHAVRCVTLHEGDGDASVMRLGDLAAAPAPANATLPALATLCQASP